MKEKLHNMVRIFKYDIVSTFEALIDVLPVLLVFVLFILPWFTFCTFVDETEILVNYGGYAIAIMVFTTVVEIFALIAAACVTDTIKNGETVVVFVTTIFSTVAGYFGNLYVYIAILVGFIIATWIYTIAYRAEDY